MSTGVPPIRRPLEAKQAQHVLRCISPELAHCHPSLPSGFGALRTTGNPIIRLRLHEILHRLRSQETIPRQSPATSTPRRHGRGFPTGERQSPA
jgi:hypothetical protein